MIFMTGDYDRGDELTRQSLELFRSLGEEAVVAELLVRRAIHLHYTSGDIAVAQALIDESQAINRRLGSRSTEAMTLGLLGEIAWTEGRTDDALELAARSGEAAAEVGSRGGRCTSSTTARNGRSLSAEPAKPRHIGETPSGLPSRSRTGS